MYKYKKLIILSIIISVLLITSTVLAQETDRQARFNFNGITADEFIGQAGVLYPFQNTENSLWFTDLRYRMSEDDIEEFNIGLGYREKIETAENTIAGAYLYKDRREEAGKYWDMWTIGGEILTDQWDFRVNGYITDDETKARSDLDSAKVVNGQIIYEEEFYSSQNGIDFEIGRRFTETNSIFKDVGIYAKYFRFFESNTETMNGRQLRIDKQFGDRDKITWKIGAQYRDDNIRGSDTEATFEVSIPFGEGEDVEIAAGEEDETKAEILEARMTEQPERDLDVIVAEGSEEKKAVDPTTGETLDVVYVDLSAENEEPVDQPDVIVLTGSNSNVTPDSYSNISTTSVEVSSQERQVSGLILKKGQKLVSANGSITIASSSDLTRTTTFSPDVEQATINLPYIEGDYSLITLEGNNTVSGINIGEKQVRDAEVSVSAPSYSVTAIEVAGTAENVKINNNQINNVNTAIDIAESTEYKEVSLTQANDVDIAAEPSTTDAKNIKINNNQINNVETAIDIPAGAVNVTYNDNIFNNVNFGVKDIAGGKAVVGKETALTKALNESIFSTINVLDGTYDLISPITVFRDAVTLTGNTSNPANVILNAPSTHDNDVFQVVADDVTIEGFKIQGSKDQSDRNNGGTNSGIVIGGDSYMLGEKPAGATGFDFNEDGNVDWSGIGVSGTTIRNNIITDNSYGIFVFHSQDITIESNEIHANTYEGETVGTWSGKGIELYTQPAMTMSSKVHSGSALPATSNVNIYGNNIHDNDSFGIELNYSEPYNLNDATKPGPFEANVVIDSNEIINNGSIDNYPWGDETYNLYRGITANGNETNVTVINNTISGPEAQSSNENALGIRISSSEDWKIENNTISDNYRGVSVTSGSTGINIVNGEIINNTTGVYIDNGSEASKDSNIYFNGNIDDIKNE